jgi:hypothetical protein
MAFSYSGMRNYGKASLPSVEDWGTNKNILRDPPKSITTRRRDKVSDTSFLTQEIQDSGDRMAGAIMAYPRGVNPMVGVSYGNARGNQQAKLPYRIADHGAFRPPVLAPVDLLPLSRMPRNTTTIYETVYNPDYTKKLSCEPEKRAVKVDPLKTNAVSSFYMKVAKPVPVSTAGNVRDIQAVSAQSALKYQPGKEQRSKYTTLLIRDKQAIEAIAPHSSFVKFNGASSAQTAALQDTLLRGEVDSVKSGVPRFITPEMAKTAIQERVRRGEEVSSNKTGYRKFVQEGEYKPRRTLLTLEGGRLSTKTGQCVKNLEHEYMEREARKTLVGERSTNANWSGAGPTAGIGLQPAPQPEFNAVMARVGGRGGIQAPILNRGAFAGGDRADVNVKLRRRT